ncbi:hypothetical protein TSAR_014453 [Trichomalopsis sarcophagae]|uniref:Uncharacterized protein n=1 Tax=Trichomalopsis sarcophagae TaxID=543379 RepID=A0A232F8G2_9HYME|nr:hypothetical protein TSAR_014453 [Trichomalopsis sarcophagae]
MELNSKMDNLRVSGFCDMSDHKRTPTARETTSACPNLLDHHKNTFNSIDHIRSFLIFAVNFEIENKNSSAKTELKLHKSYNRNSVINQLNEDSEQKLNIVRKYLVYNLLKN